MQLETKTISALVHLLDDPDYAVFQKIRKDLLNCGSEVIPLLEGYLLEQHLSIDSVIRIQQLIQELRLKENEQVFVDWIYSSDKDLFEALGIISQCQFPDLDIVQLKNQLFELRRDIWLEINPKQTSFEIIKIFNRIFFEHYKFNVVPFKNTRPYHHFLQMILEDREGSEIGIALIYSIIAQSLNLPVYGVNFMHKKVLLAHLDQFHILEQLNISGSNGILFYLDTAEKGSFKNQAIIREELLLSGQQPSRAFLEPAPNTSLVRMYLQQIILSYHQWNDQGAKAIALERLLQLLDEA